MSRFTQKQGFTLIELMVVIVIIGVLASLAIPRFTEASSKAKVAEAPRVLGSFESAYLAAVAETGDKSTLTAADLVFDAPKDSRWFEYAVSGSGAGVCTAKATGDLGKFTKGGTLVTTYNDTTFNHTSSLDAVASKMVPNFCGAKKCK